MRGICRTSADDAVLIKEEAHHKRNALVHPAAVHKKKWALGGHGNMYGIAAAENRPMILIGG